MILNAEQAASLEAVCQSLNPTDRYATGIVFALLLAAIDLHPGDQAAARASAREMVVFILSLTQPENADVWVKAVKRVNSINESLSMLCDDPDEPGGPYA